MDGTSQELIKHREIVFCSLHPDPAQAQSAMLVLTDIEGVEHMRLISHQRLHVTYDIRRVCLQWLEEVLEELGFHLDNSLFTKLRRALYHYTEEVQRDNLKCPKGETNCTDKVFVNRYQRLPHGCRDDRPPHWRKYL